MFERIIISSEPSSEKHDITECLRGFRKLGARESLLLNCIDPNEGGAKISSFYQETLEKFSQRQKEILESQGYQVHIKVVIGEADEEVNQLAKVKDYSLVVVGEPVQSRIREKFLGGTNYKIIHHSKIPTLIVRISEPFEEEVLTDKCQITDHILFPTDFSQNSAEAFHLIMEMVKAGVKEVSLIHVLGDESSECMDKECMDKLEEYRKKLVEAGAKKAEGLVLHGNPSNEIINHALESKVSLIVMGSQGRGFIKEIFLGSVSHEIVRKSPVSVMLIPKVR